MIVDTSVVRHDRFKKKESWSKDGVISAFVMTYVINSITHVMFICLSYKNEMDGENPLIIPCEVAVKSVIPAAKALMAKELVEKHGLKQDQVAKILGISQSAVSKYTRKIRGYLIELDTLEEIHPLVDMTIASLADGTSGRGEFLALFCQMCVTIRKTGAMCQFCKKTEPAIETGKCDYCMTHDSQLVKR